MKITMEFQLPEDADDLFLAMHAATLRMATKDVKEHIRSRLKHGLLGEEATAEFEDLQRALNEALEDLPGSLR